MKRYKIAIGPFGPSQNSMREFQHPEGEWVRYEDIRDLFTAASCVASGSRDLLPNDDGYYEIPAFWIEDLKKEVRILAEK